MPVGRKCGDCQLGLTGLCKAADRSKVSIGRKLKEEKFIKDEEGNVLEKEITVKTEEITDSVMARAGCESQLLVQDRTGSRVEES